MAKSLFEAQEKAIYGAKYREVVLYKKRIEEMELELEELHQQNLMLRYNAILVEQGITEENEISKAVTNVFDSKPPDSERVR